LFARFEVANTRYVVYIPKTSERRKWSHYGCYDLSYQSFVSHDAHPCYVLEETIRITPNLSAPPRIPADSSDALFEQDPLINALQFPDKYLDGYIKMYRTDQIPASTVLKRRQVPTTDDDPKSEQLPSAKINGMPAFEGRKKGESTPKTRGRFTWGFKNDPIELSVNEELEYIMDQYGKNHLLDHPNADDNPSMSPHFESRDIADGGLVVGDGSTENQRIVYKARCGRPLKGTSGSIRTNSGRRGDPRPHLSSLPKKRRSICKTDEDLPSGKSIPRGFYSEKSARSNAQGVSTCVLQFTHGCAI
jgi:hypothetical protein